ncbi:MAG: NADH-quinone oxidoreductase subunit NuoE [Alphaproteobacteria bacterium]
MSARTPAPAAQQPASFAFSKKGAERARQIVARYPEGRQQSAVIPLLDLAQREAGGWVPRAAMDHIAEMLQMAPIRVYEVATFYSMFNLRPVGTHLVQVCRTTPCWLRGSDELTEACRRKLGIGLGETTVDGAFTLVEVECLGACVNAPMVQINDDYYEDLTGAEMERLLDDLAAGKKVKVGSQTGRIGSEPPGGATTLDELPNPPVVKTLAFDKPAEPKPAPAEKG